MQKQKIVSLYSSSTFCRWIYLYMTVKLSITLVLIILRYKHDTTRWYEKLILMKWFGFMWWILWLTMIHMLQSKTCVDYNHAAKKLFEKWQYILLKQISINPPDRIDPHFTLYNLLYSGLAILQCGGVSKHSTGCYVKWVSL